MNIISVKNKIKMIAIFILIMLLSISSAIIFMADEEGQSQFSVSDRIRSFSVIYHPDILEAAYQNRQEQINRAIDSQIEWRSMGQITSLEEAMGRDEDSGWPEIARQIVHDANITFTLNFPFERLFIFDHMITTRFVAQYAENSLFHLLISDEIGQRHFSVRASEFLRDSEAIEEMVRQEIDEEIVDVRFVMVNSARILYIRGIITDFGILVYDTANPRQNRQMPNSVEFFQIHTMAEILESLGEMYTDGTGNHNAIAMRTTLHYKPTFQTQAQALQEMGLLQGNEHGDLDLLRPLTRMEAITMLVRALGLDNEPVQAVSSFIDIADDNWGRPYANIALAHGITQGIGDDMFAPNAIITADQFATLVLRSSDQVNDFDWQQAITMLIEMGIITEQDADTMDLFTRGDMAKIIYEAMARGLF